MPDVAWIAFVTVALFGITGFGVTRLLLPDGLRRHEWLWVLPTGAVATAFTMTPLGFLGLPFRVNLALVVAGGAALTVLALRTRGLPARPALPSVAWPAYLWVLLVAVALVPLFRAGFLTVIGNGSDAHLAAGTAEFLRHSAPRGVDAALPVDQMPLVWRSKQAIYYAFAAVSALSGLETWQVLSTLGALLLGLAAVGWFVFAREVLGTGIGAAAVAMAVAGTIRMVVHTGIHPYFNQTWGYLAVPFALTLAWWVVQHRSRGGTGLLALFLVVCAFAYPLAVPIPGVVLAVMWWVDRRRRRREGEHVLGARDLWRRLRGLRRSIRVAGAVLAVLLLVPAWGVWEKIVGANQILVNPNYSLAEWGGDLSTWFPERQFFAIGVDRGWWLALAVIAGLALWELWRLPRPVRLGLLTVLAAAVLVAASMRARDHGYYFHFKMLAFAGPLVVVLGVAALARLRAGARSRAVQLLATLALVVWVGWGAAGARDEVAGTFDQLPRSTIELATWSAELPDGASVRLDVEPGFQLWSAYMLHDHPLCSQRPLTGTSYPHVPVSRGADFVLARYVREPYDAAGPPVMANGEYRLYRLRPGLPGGDRCSQRMVQTVSRIEQG